MTTATSSFIPQVQPTSPLRSLLRHCSQTLGSLFNPSTEPHLTTLRDEAGETWYRLYDPSTGTVQWSTTEDEILRWLDR